MTDRFFASPEGREHILAAYDTVLGLWPIPYQTHTIATRHGETFVLTCGDPASPPLVLLHGSASNTAMWAGDAAAYATRYHVIAIDMPGEPGRSQVLRFDLDGPAAAEWLLDVLAALGLARVDLVGISLGGWLALKLAVTAPERVRKLVLLCPGGVVPMSGLILFQIVPLSLLGGWGSDRVMTLLNGGQPVNADILRFSRVINHNFRPRMEPLPLFTDDELRRLTLPVLLEAGARDPMFDMHATAVRLQRLLPHLTVDMLPQAGHVLANLSGRVLPFLQA